MMMFLLVLACVYVRIEAAEVLVPCSQHDANPLQNISIMSNTQYTLLDCDRSIVFLTNTKAISNISFVVRGGQVLPSINVAAAVLGLFLLVEDVRTAEVQPFTGTLWYQYCWDYPSVLIDLLDAQIIVRNNVLQFTDVDEPTFIYLYDNYNLPRPRLHNLSVLIDNNTISQGCVSFCYLVYLFLPASNITVGNMRVLNSNVTFRALFAPHTYTDFGAVFMKSSALLSLYLLMFSLSVRTDLGNICGGSYDPYHSDASAVLVNIQNSNLFESTITVQQLTATLQAISQLTLVNALSFFLNDTSVVIDTATATMELCNPTGYAPRGAAAASPSIGVVSVGGRNTIAPGRLQRVNITISNVNVNGSVRDDLLLGLVPLPLNSTQPVIGYSVLYVGALRASSDVAFVVRESTAQVLLRVCLTTTTSTMMPNIGIGFTIVNVALVAISGVELSFGVIHIDLLFLVLLESSTFMQQIT